MTSDGCDLTVQPQVVRIVWTECSYWLLAGRVEGSEDGVFVADVMRDCSTGSPDRTVISGAGGSITTDESVLVEAEPLAVSLLGSQTRLRLSGCTESSSADIVESVTRTPAGQSTLEYLITAEDDQWIIQANNFPTTSFVIDFLDKTQGPSFGDRVARARKPSMEAFDMSFCSTGSEGRTQWEIEYFTSDPQYRQAVLAAMIGKAFRDDSRDPATGETASSMCFVSYLALALGLPLLGGLVGLVILLLLILSRMRKSAKTAPTPQKERRPEEATNQFSTRRPPDKEQAIVPMKRLSVSNDGPSIEVGTSGTPSSEVLSSMALPPRQARTPRTPGTVMVGSVTNGETPKVSPSASGKGGPSKLNKSPVAVSNGETPRGGPSTLNKSPVAVSNGEAPRGVPSNLNKPPTAKAKPKVRDGTSNGGANRKEGKPQKKALLDAGWKREDAPS
eukprot:CAMPEP_0206226094 /NCGR_PEP_ID=MMETSP0047_2-20121206/7889_1 /ASSEMBLY_ACC=CAM_ASM_000192 /TAXON_ID=195065 /ORGANISM="Chroomonas mesostigmatica_cf, Strain CCMP1168" /LENGTH=446 /DNA_ID=CAMNT_0053649121 /DNA_START=193 /DNA_END=1533 /DNA_ORIENTATION=+